MSQALDPKTMIIFLLTAFLGGMAAYIISVVRNAEPAAPSTEIALCSDEPGINDQVNKIAFKALDEALEKQIGNLFLVWMKDNSGQPARAGVGVKTAALAYVHARTSILAWNIPPCKGTP